MQRLLPRFRLIQFFRLRDTRRERFSFVLRRHAGVPLRGTNIEARNEQKYLLPSVEDC